MDKNIKVPEGDRPHIRIHSAMDDSSSNILTEVELNGTGQELAAMAGAALQNLSVRLSIPPEADEKTAKHENVIRVISEIASYALLLQSSEAERADMQRCGLTPFAYHISKIDKNLTTNLKHPAPAENSPCMMATMYIDPTDDSVMSDISFNGRYNDGADLITGFLQSFYQMITENAPENVTEFVKNDLKNVCISALETADGAQKSDPAGSVIPINRNKLN